MIMAMVEQSMDATLVLQIEQATILIDICILGVGVLPLLVSGTLREILYLELTSDLTLKVLGWSSEGARLRDSVNSTMYPLLGTLFETSSRQSALELLR